MDQPDNVPGVATLKVMESQYSTIVPEEVRVSSTKAPEGPVFKGVLIFLRVITISPEASVSKPLVIVIFPEEESNVHLKLAVEVP